MWGHLSFPEFSRLTQLFLSWWNSCLCRLSRLIRLNSGPKRWHQKIITKCMHFCWGEILSPWLEDKVDSGIGLTSTLARVDHHGRCVGVDKRWGYSQLRHRDPYTMFGFGLRLAFNVCGYHDIHKHWKPHFSWNCPFKRVSFYISDHLDECITKICQNFRTLKTVLSLGQCFFIV